MATAANKRGPVLLGAGVVAALLAVLLVAAGGIGLGVDSARDSTGYLSSGTEHYSTPGYALETNSYRTGSIGDVAVPAKLIGNVRVHVSGSQPVFAGIGPSGAVERYLEGV